MESVTVGQIGLGTMGGNLARHLLGEGFDVVGFDVDDDAMAELAAHGGRRADSNADLAADADVVLSALSYPEVVEAAYLGDDGVVEGAHEDLVCIEQSTTPPEPTRELADVLADHGVDLLDAPFLGGPPNASDGTVVLPVGGRRAAYDDERVRAVLDAASRATHYMGESGAGKATKLVNNCISLGNTVLALEALALGAAQGLDVADLHDALKYGAASSVMFRVVLPAALNREFEPGFPVSYARKDLRYALRAAEAVDFPLDVASTILQQYTAAAATGHADDDATAVTAVFEAWIEGTLEAEGGVAPETQDPILTK